MAYAQDAGPVEVAGETVVVTEETPESPSDFFALLFEKVNGGEWLPAFGAALMLLVFGARKFLGTFVDWFNTKLGGSTLAFGISLAMAASTALLAGQPITLALAATALGVAWAAGGGWENFKDILGYLSKDKEEA
jgi:hypothetical protein